MNTIYYKDDLTVGKLEVDSKDYTLHQGATEIKKEEYQTAVEELQKAKEKRMAESMRIVQLQNKAVFDTLTDEEKQEYKDLVGGTA